MVFLRLVGTTRRSSLCYFFHPFFSVCQQKLAPWDRTGKVSIGFRGQTELWLEGKQVRFHYFGVFGNTLFLFMYPFMDTRCLLWSLLFFNLLVPWCGFPAALRISRLGVFVSNCACVCDVFKDCR